ncbi:MAG: E3 ubiquitin-protein ligase rad18 [Alyxoria varia]|nr:MAG: E3 ubiquitin-protein ligase rad18 [Alyxoria varia]
MSTEPRTRSQKKAASQSSTPNSAPSTSQNDGAIVVDSDQNEEEYLPDAAIQEQPPRKSPQGKAEDGLVACPICGRRMKEEFVFPHTDTCTGAASPSTQQSSERTGSSRPAPPMSQQLRRQNETPPLERLPQITYSIFRDQALRKKLSELGIPSWGSRQLLIKRHSEWLALWNANCDSTRPRPKATLMSDLEKWERSQGGHAPQGGASVFGCSANGGSGTGFTAASVMQKGFDGNEWAQSHQDDFKSLIAKAREKRNATASIKSDENANGKEEPTTAEAIDGREISQTGTSLVSDLKNNEAQIKPSKPPEMLPESRRNDQGPGEGDAPTDVAQPGYPSALKEAREAHAMGPREEEICERLNGPNEAINDSMPNQMLSLSNGPESEGAMREDGCVNEARRRKQPMFAAPS